MSILLERQEVQKETLDLAKLLKVVGGTDVKPIGVINQTEDKKDMIVKKKVEVYVSLIQEKIFKMLEKIECKSWLEKGESYWNLVKELNALGEGLGVVDKKIGFAEGSISTVLQRQKSYFLMFGPMDNVTTERWNLTLEGRQLYEDLKFDKTDFSRKTFDLLMPFLKGFEEKDEIGVIFEHNHLYTRDEPGVISKKDFEEGVLTGKVRLMYNDGKMLRPVEAVLLSKIKIN